MDRITGIAAQILQYGWDHPGLLVVTAVVAAAVGVITWRRSSRGN